MIRAPPTSLLAAAPASSSVQRPAGHHQRRAETLRLRRVFEMFDRDGDGVITPAELSGVLGRLGGARHGEAPPAAAALDAVVAAYIAPGMPGLRFADFEALHAELAGGAGRDQHGGDVEVVEEHRDDDDVDMREAFGVFDEDGDGYISAAELQAVLARMGLPEAACMARVRDMITAADRNSDGRVDYEEFKAMMAGGTNV